MSVQVEKLEKGMAKLTIEVPAEELDPADGTTYVWECLEGAITRCLENMTLQDILDNYDPPIEYYI